MDSSEEYKEFLCNTLLIKALLQFLPIAGEKYILDRKKSQAWLTKLQEIEDGMPDAKARNEYTFYLLINVQNGTLSQPFSKAPPPGKLTPLCKILVGIRNISLQTGFKEPDFLYEDVQKQIKTSYCRINRMLNENTDDYEMPALRCEPGGFQDEQPKPHKGVMAMCAAFSNYEDEKNSK